MFGMKRLNEGGVKLLVTRRVRKEQPRVVAAASTTSSSVTLGHSLPIKPLPSTAHLHPHALPARDAPFGLIARLSLEEEASERGVESEAVLAKSKPPKKASTKPVLQHPTSDSESDSEDPITPPNASQSQSQLNIDLGIASSHYFSPGPTTNLSLRRILNARAPPPPILARGFISWEEAEQLFDIFYDRCAMYVSVLDREIHNARSVVERCPFLFTIGMSLLHSLT